VYFVQVVEKIDFINLFFICNSADEKLYEKKTPCRGIKLLKASDTGRVQNPEWQKIKMEIEKFKLFENFGKLESQN
jgi:hypothetical protein